MSYSATSPAIDRHFRRHQIRALTLTYLAYSSFHISRKPLSIIKTTLSSSFPPFNTPRGPHRLGELDLFFLLSYALSMLLSAPLADRLPLRPLLSSSMLAAALSTAALSLPFFLHIHRLSFFLAVQLASGLSQSVAWPCVVAVVTNWFGNSPRVGLVMGVWNSHASVGNVVGSVFAAFAMEFGWGWSFVLAGAVLGFAGVLVFGFLVAGPREVVGMEEMDCGVEMGNVDLGVCEENGLLLGGVKGGGEEEVIGFFAAWRLPGVAAYACCLFFSKLVAYTFLYWLPFYIRHTGMGGDFGVLLSIW